LFDFVKSFEFDRLGVFTYSPEEDTASYNFTDQISEDVKELRLDRLMKLQKAISRKRNRLQKNTIHKTIVEAFDSESNFYYGRSYAFAPDDIDGMIVFQSKKKLEIGEVCEVQIKTVFEYDLIGDAMTEEES